MTTPAYRLDLARERDHLTELACWTGRAGNRNRRILYAIYNLAIRAETRTLSFSVRQLADKLGINKETAAKGVRELLGEGWLRRDGTVTHDDIAVPTYVVGPTHDLKRKLGRNPYVTSSEGKHVSKTTSNVRITSVLWDRDGFGVPAGRIYGYLDMEGQTVKQLVGHTGYSDKTVRYKLSVLAWFRLAFRQGRQWFRGEADPNEVAREIGAGERRKELEKRHAAEREHYMEHLPELERRRALARAAVAQRPERRPELEPRHEAAPLVSASEALRRLLAREADNETAHDPTGDREQSRADSSLGEHLEQLA